MTDVIMTVQNDNRLTDVIEDSPALLGWETSNTELEDGRNIEFCDWPFTKDDVNVADHIDAVRRHTPRYAVAPDVEGKWTLDRVTDVADDLSRYADTVIVVPKDVEPDYVPERFAIGYPNQPNFGSNGGWFRWEYNRDVHVLGGSPDSQLDVAGYMPVQSVDGANVAVYAQYGRVWTADGQEERPGLSYYERVSESLSNVCEVWNGRCEVTA